MNYYPLHSHWSPYLCFFSVISTVTETLPGLACNTGPRHATGNTREAYQIFCQRHTMLRQLRLRARGQGVGPGPAHTQTGAQATHGAKHTARRPLASAVREARAGTVLTQHTHPEALSRPGRDDAAGPLHVYAPSMEEASTSGSSTDEEFLENNALPATSLAVETEGKGGLSSSVSSSEILAPVVADMQQLTVNLRSVVGERHPMLMAAADQIFGAGGKKLRPAIVFLVARATCELAGLRCGPVLCYMCR